MAEINTKLVKLFEQDLEKDENEYRLFNDMQLEKQKKQLFELDSDYYNIRQIDNPSINNFIVNDDHLSKLYNKRSFRSNANKIED